jgi:hypothetical protein
MAAQDLLRAAARAAGWAAEYEVRGFGWIADVLCAKNGCLIALEDQLVGNQDLVVRTENYRRSGVRVAWFTPRLRRRTISRLIGTIPIFDVDEIDTVVPQLLAACKPLPRTVRSKQTCSSCGCPVSTVGTFWCWSCWLRFTTPSMSSVAPSAGHDGQVAHPLVHLTDWNRAREQRYTEWEERMRAFAELAGAHKGTGLSGAARFRR